MHGRQTDIRVLLWSLCLAILTGICIAWAALPALDSSPLLRTSLFATGGLAMLGLVFFFPDISSEKGGRLILLTAVILRLILLAAPPSDDVSRYLWEGRLVLDGGNPYSAVAADPILKSRRDVTWDNMNHRDRPTAYPPGIEWLMAATVAIHPSLFSFKILALLGDLAVLLLLRKLLQEQSAPIRWLGFYAFNPIVLIAFAAEGHFDSLMVAALLAALLSASRNRASTWFWLGAAIQIKLVCIVLFPLFFLGKLRRSSYLLPLILILPGLPFLSALPAWIDGLRQFAGDSAFNAPLFSLLASTGMGLETVKRICMVGFGISASAICVSRWRGLPLIDSCLWMLGAVLACSPIVHFWYLTWLLPLATLRPSFAWITLSITMAGYFLAWHTQDIHGWWGFGHGTAAYIWIPWLLAGIAQNRFLFTKWISHRTSDRSSEFRPVESTLTIILPILKPTPSLIPLIQNLRSEAPPGTEIILSNCDSQSPDIPTTRNIPAPRGRGNQIAAGIAATRGDWILIVHADATPCTGLGKIIEKAILSRPDAAMFVFGQRFDRQTIGTTVIEALNEMRIVFGGVAFGDQTMLLSRRALEKSGGFPAQPLMEDVEASMRIAAQGATVYLGREWKVSGIKWQIEFPKRVWLVLSLVARYQLARLRGKSHAATVSERMYREYYR